MLLLNYDSKFRQELGQKIILISLVGAVSIEPITVGYGASIACTCTMSKFTEAFNEPITKMNNSFPCLENFFTNAGIIIHIVWH